MPESRCTRAVNVLQRNKNIPRLRDGRHGKGPARPRLMRLHPSNVTILPVLQISRERSVCGGSKSGLLTTGPRIFSGSDQYHWA